MQEKIKIRKGKQFLIILIAFLVLGISFKVMVLVEGLTEIRPVNAIPPVAGLLCGPIGGGACALGNLLADMAGTFSLSSVLGVIANFLAAYLPYRLWYLFSKESPNLHCKKNILLYCLICFVTAMTAAWILAFGLYIFWHIWLEEIYIYVFLNNFGFSLGLGMPILIILTSDSVNVVCCDPPASGRLCKSSAKRNIVCGGYLLLMLLILTGVFLHCNPADNSWMKWISWLAGLGLCCQMI